MDWWATTEPYFFSRSVGNELAGYTNSNIIYLGPLARGHRIGLLSSRLEFSSVRIGINGMVHDSVRVWTRPSISGFHRRFGHFPSMFSGPTYGRTRQVGFMTQLGKLLVLGLHWA